MRVRLHVQSCSAFGCFAPGTVVTLPDHEAAALVAAGLADCLDNRQEATQPPAQRNADAPIGQATTVAPSPARTSDAKPPASTIGKDANAHGEAKDAKARHRSQKG